MSFDYLLGKIAEAEFETVPFRHVYIKNFFDNQHFSEIVSAPEVLLPAAESDEQIFNRLFEQNYKIIDFPGCITDRNLYIKWHRERRTESKYSNSACEGFGVTLRLSKPTSRIIKEVFDFMLTKEFQEALASKFEIKGSDISYDAGIQKYLDGYEISPHPDIRAKALTYMININPGADSESRDHHTHYLRFREEFKYIQAYWDGHPNEDRFWVPWSWCDQVKMQRENNSLVIFSPDNTTLHAVRAQYNHLHFQRTQMYGNFWYKNRKCDSQPKWEDFTFGKVTAKAPDILTRVKTAVPVGVKQFIKNGIRRDKNVNAEVGVKKFIKR
jgi:hypothetical protein